MYCRTLNENGTWNARCLHCFMTIASAVETEAALEAFEANHMCPEGIFAELNAENTTQPAHPQFN
ncbi:MAG: hypothetical protein ABSF17_17195 [Terracidiphilus sp.]|jgi:hypothetical protein